MCAKMSRSSAPERAGHSSVPQRSSRAPEDPSRGRRPRKTRNSSILHKVSHAMGSVFDNPQQRRRSSSKSKQRPQSRGNAHASSRVPTPFKIAEAPPCARRVFPQGSQRNVRLHESARHTVANEHELKLTPEDMLQTRNFSKIRHCSSRNPSLSEGSRRNLNPRKAENMSSSATVKLTKGARRRVHFSDSKSSLFETGSATRAFDGPCTEAFAAASRESPTPTEAMACTPESDDGNNSFSMRSSSSGSSRSGRFGLKSILANPDAPCSGSEASPRPAAAEFAVPNMLEYRIPRCLCRVQDTYSDNDIEHECPQYYDSDTDECATMLVHDTDSELECEYWAYASSSNDEDKGDDEEDDEEERQPLVTNISHRHVQFAATSRDADRDGVIARSPRIGSPASFRTTEDQPRKDHTRELHTTVRNATTEKESAQCAIEAKPSNIHGPILSARQIANGHEPGYSLLRSLLIVQEYVLDARRSGNTECTIVARDYENFGVVNKKLEPDMFTRNVVAALRNQGYFVDLRRCDDDTSRYNLFVSWKHHCV